MEEGGVVADPRHASRQHEASIARDQPPRRLKGVKRRARHQLFADASLVGIVEADAKARVPHPAARGQGIVDLPIGRVHRIRDPIIHQTVIPLRPAVARAGNEHAFVLRHAKRFGEGDELFAVAPLVAPKIGRDVIELLLLLILGQQHDAFEGKRDHAEIVGVDIGRAHELPPGRQLLPGEF